MEPLQPGNTFISYKFIEESSPKRLEAAMLQIQVNASKSVNFTPPQYNTKTDKYESWYLYDFAADLKPKQKLDMENK